MGGVTKTNLFMYFSAGDDIFANYPCIILLKVLYLKNLPNKVTENELGALFLRYQTSESLPITFRIMTGKMKGQAFVTFDSKYQNIT